MDELIKVLTRLLKLFGYGCFIYLFLGILASVLVAIYSKYLR